MNLKSAARVLIAVELLILVGCGSVQRRKDAEARAEAQNQAPQTQVEPVQTAPQARPVAAADLDSAPQASLNSRLDRIEAKIAALNEKIDSTRVEIDNLMGVKPATPSAVPQPAAANRGSRVEVAPAKGDPESGFVNDSAVGSYRQAMILFDANKYSEAAVAFSSFLEHYPDHPLAGSAQYYVGECYFRQKQYQLAYEELQKVTTSYDRSPQLSETLKRLADTADLLNKPAESARYRQLLTSLFPQSPANATSVRAPEHKAEQAKPAVRTEAPTHEAIPSDSTGALDEPPVTAPVSPETKEEKAE